MINGSRCRNALKRTLCVIANLLTTRVLVEALVNILTSFPIAGQLEAGFTGARIAAESVVAIVVTVGQARAALVDVATRAPVDF